MVTTNRLISIEAFGSDPPELVHLTGSFQVVARVTMEDAAPASPPPASGYPARAAGGPVHVEVCCDAARVRGVGLKSGARYEARGAYRLVDDAPELPAPLHLVSAFELLRHDPGDLPTRLLLVIHARVTVQTDGKVSVGIEAPQLLPCEGHR
jgi:hypothetical protein